MAIKRNAEERRHFLERRKVHPSSLEVARRCGRPTVGLFITFSSWSSRKVFFAKKRERVPLRKKTQHLPVIWKSLQSAFISFKKRSTSIFFSYFVSSLRWDLRFTLVTFIIRLKRVLAPILAKKASNSK